MEISGQDHIELEFERGDGKARVVVLPSTLQIQEGWSIRLTIKSNWNGITYPLSDSFVGTTSSSNDSAFVGLAEIRFLTNDGERLLPIAEAPDTSASSELTFRSFDRRANYVVDGSGLEETKIGWASLGMPFYADAIDYNFRLSIDSIPNVEKVLLNLDDWDGALAVVLYKDQILGKIGWYGQTLDLTNVIQQARDESHKEMDLTVRVYGTPKNLLGPHHAGKLRGSAWPGSFHQAPERQPTGTSYDVIEYGLFPKKSYQNL